MWFSTRHFHIDYMVPVFLCVFLCDDCWSLTEQILQEITSNLTN